jgi:hypothetical protein
MLYGGGLTHGQIIGESTRDGGSPVGQPLTPDDVLATICHTLFNFGQARLLPGLPNDLRQALDRIEKMTGVL